MIKLFVPSKEPSHRRQRVAEEIRKILSKIIQEEELPITRDENGVYLKPENPVTVTYVSMSPDLKHARVGITPLGGTDQEQAAAYMRLNGWFLRKYLAKHLRARVIPALSFKPDTIFDEAEKINELLERVAPKDKAPEGQV